MFRQTKESVECPVCESDIGERWMQDSCSAYCKECKFTFYFKAYETYPHRNAKGKFGENFGCGCGGCGR